MTSPTRWLLPLVVFALATLPYLSGLRNGFTFDDDAIAAENTRIRSVSGLAEIARTDWWHGSHPENLHYRPLAMATYTVDYAVARLGESGPAPARLPDRAAAPFHMQNIAWHGAASVALFALVLAMFASPALAFGAGALFAVHPVHTEAVYGIVGRAELVSACFVFLALLAGWRATQRNGSGIGGAIVPGLLLLLALLSKEHAIVTPLIPLIWLGLLSPPERARLARRPSYRALVVAFASAVALFLILRTAVLGSLGAHGQVTTLVDPNNPIATATGAPRILTPMRVLAETFRVLLFPRTLSADYSYPQIPLVTSLDLPTLAGIAGLAAAVAGAVLLRRRLPAAAFGLAIFLLFWFPTSNVAFATGTIFGERLLYLASSGLCLTLAALILAAAERVRAPRAAWVVIGLLVVAGSARTWSRAADWKDDLTLFRSTALASPRSCKAAYNHGFELQKAGLMPEAAAEFGRANGICPGDAKILNNLAGALAALGRTDEALTRLEEAIRLDPRNPDPLVNLAGLLAGAGRADEALAAYDRALRERPRDVASLQASARILMGQNRLPEAVARYEQVVRIEPGSASAHNDLGVALARANEMPRALEAFREAARLDPQFEDARRNVGRAEAALRSAR